MRVLTVGGGSGGHVTPVLAVINELAATTETGKLEVYFLTDHAFGERARHLMDQAAVPVTTRQIYGGKLRRYHGVSLAKQLLDIPTTLRNVRDLLYICLGGLQSIFYIATWRPDVVFSKGGFVCLPVGIVASRLFRIPLVIHDSDAHPGLTNRLLAPHATAIATGAPLDNYRYPAAKSHYVGIPVDSSFRPLSHTEKTRLKTELLGFSDARLPVVVVTGGGLGARRLNTAVSAIAPALLERGIGIVHITGSDEFRRVEQAGVVHENYKLLPFVHQNMAQTLGAADLVVTRAGATTLLELAALKQATVIVPNDMLPGGHQTKNAAVYSKAEAAVVLSEAAIEADHELLLRTIADVLSDSRRLTELARRIGSLARPDAAADTAQLIVRAVGK